VGQESQDTSSTEIYTPPLLQPDTISPHSRVALDTQTHNAQSIDISPQQLLLLSQTITYWYGSQLCRTRLRACQGERRTNLNASSASSFGPLLVGHSYLF